MPAIHYIEVEQNQMTQWYSPFNIEESRVLSEFSEAIPRILEMIHTGAECPPGVDNSEIEESHEEVYIWDERGYAESTIECLRTCEEYRRNLETVDHPLALEGHWILFMVLQITFSEIVRYRPHNAGLLDDFEKLLLERCDLGNSDEMLKRHELRAFFYPVLIEEQQRNWRLVDLQCNQSLREVAAKIESVKTRTAIDSTVPRSEPLERTLLTLPERERSVFEVICLANDAGTKPTAKQIANSLGLGAQLEGVKKVCSKLKQKALIQNRNPGYLVSDFELVQLVRSKTEKLE